MQNFKKPLHFSLISTKPLLSILLICNLLLLTLFSLYTKKQRFCLMEIICIFGRWPFTTNTELLYYCIELTKPYIKIADRCSRWGRESWRGRWGRGSWGGAARSPCPSATPGCCGRRAGDPGHTIMYNHLTQCGCLHTRYQYLFQVGTYITM